MMKVGPIFIVLIASVHGQPCTTKESLNITNGELFENGSVIFEGLEYPSSVWYEVTEDGVISRMGCPCVGRVCVWKCCPAGQAYYNRQCKESELEVVNPFSPPLFKGVNPVNGTAQFFYMNNRLCEDRYMVDSSSPYEEMYIQEVS